MEMEMQRTRLQTKRSSRLLKHTAPQPPRDTMGGLPDAILREMLAFFTLDELLELENVDASWRDAIADSGAWTAIALHHEQDGERVRRVLHAVATRHGPAVERLEIVNCALVDAALSEITNNFTGLKTLVVSGCKALTDAGLSALLTASRQSLTELRAVRCPMLTDTSLAIANACHGQTLTKVDVSHCRFLTRDGVEALVKDASNLQFLGLKGCPKVNDAAVVAVAQHCPQLRCLLLGGSGALTDVALQALGDRCPQLQTLDIARSNPFGISRGGVSDSGVTFLLSKSKQMQQLVLRGQGGLTPTALMLLPSHCPQLKSLDIGGCRRIVQNPAALCGLLKKMAGLEQLSVSFCGGIMADQDVTSIASECRKLKKFEVDGETIVAAIAST